jgi:hypothetical protein
MKETATAPRKHHIVKRPNGSFLCTKCGMPWERFEEGEEEPEKLTRSLFEDGNCRCYGDDS